MHYKSNKIRKNISNYINKILMPVGYIFKSVNNLFLAKN